MPKYWAVDYDAISPAERRIHIAQMWLHALTMIARSRRDRLEHSDCETVKSFLTQTAAADIPEIEEVSRMRICDLLGGKPQGDDS